MVSVIELVLLNVSAMLEKGPVAVTGGFAAAQFSRRQRQEHLQSLERAPLFIYLLTRPDNALGARDQKQRWQLSCRQRLESGGCATLESFADVTHSE